MNVLLTGGSGFLGKRIKFFLEKDGHKCISLRSSELNLEKDISSQVLEKINSINNNIEVIIHSAVFYGGIGTNLKYPFDLILRNNMMSNNIYLLAQKLKVRKFISVGSACAWPGNKSGDLKEDEVLLNITSRLIVNKIAYKVMNEDISMYMKKFEELVNA